MCGDVERRDNGFNRFLSRIEISHGPDCLIISCEILKSEIKVKKKSQSSLERHCYCS